MTKRQLKRKYPIRFRKPWRVSPDSRKNNNFKRDCIRAGLLSPNFPIAEARCHDGTDLPKALYDAGQRLAFTLEQVRHDVGDKPIVALSWFRTRSHNQSVGGASQSRHMSGDAIDPNRGAMANFGVNLYKFDVSAKRRFARGGIGTDRRSGIVMHVDTRQSGPSRWTYN